jgi:hypothetical protein
LDAVPRSSGRRGRGGRVRGGAVHDVVGEEGDEKARWSGSGGRRTGSRVEGWRQAVCRRKF